MSQFGFYTVGLPGSGKTTAAMELLKERNSVPLSGNVCVRMNMDDMRDEFTNGDYSAGKHVWDPKFEKQVAGVFMERMLKHIKQGRDILADNTYLNPNTRKKLVTTFIQNGVTPVIMDFRHVGVNECIKRDKERMKRGERGVGIDVILRMWHDYIVPDIKKPRIDPSLPNAIICDLDGTLAELNGRNPYDCSNCHITDTPNLAVSYICKSAQANGTTLLFTSGRTDNYKPQTLTFLNNDGFYFVDDYTQLFMRPTGDTRPDWVFKQEVYDRHIRGHYNVLFCIDDRPQVCRQWIENGLTVFNVGNRGEF
jgi:predicted kinase